MSTIREGDHDQKNLADATLPKKQGATYTCHVIPEPELDEETQATAVSGATHGYVMKGKVRTHGELRKKTAR